MQVNLCGSSRISSYDMRAWLMTTYVIDYDIRSSRFQLVFCRMKVVAKRERGAEWGGTTYAIRC